MKTGFINDIQRDTQCFKVIVPDFCNGKERLISYPMRGHSLYTAAQAVEVMESFRKRSPRRVTEGDKLEIWAESDNCRFTLAMWNENFAGIKERFA